MDIKRKAIMNKASSQHTKENLADLGLDHSRRRTDTRLIAGVLRQNTALHEILSGPQILPQSTQSIYDFLLLLCSSFCVE